MHRRNMLTGPQYADARSRLVSVRLFRVMCACATALLLSLVMLTGAPAAHAGAVEFLEVHIDDTGGIDGLDGVESVVLSPDGAHLYAGGSDESAIAAFARDTTTGHLTYLGSVVDGVGGVDGIGNVRGMSMSPDGAHLYATGFSDDAIAVFERNPSTGELTFVEAHKDGVGGITSLNGAFGVSVSPEGTHVYVASNVEDAVTVFSRDADTGRLTVAEVHRNGVGVTSLDGAEAVIVSHDGAHVYVASEDADAISVFRRDEDTGELLFVEAQQDEVDVDALDRVQGLALSADGAHLYAASGIDNAIVVFERDPATGRLTLIEVHQDGVGGVDGLGGAEWVVLSPSGAYVYAASDIDNALTVFARDAATGRLSYIETIRNGDGGANGLGGAEGVIASAAHVYVASDFDNAVAVFASLCGNGRFDAGEQCEDGNTVSGDCCSASCTNEAAGSACPDDGNVCTDEQCNGAGICMHINNTAPCDDGAFCTVDDICQDGICAGAARDCSAAGDHCNDGSCDEIDDECVGLPVIDGSPCDDGDLCTRHDSCMAGVCIGADSVICTALDQCHDAGTCSPATGECTNPEKTDGVPCDDGNACTQLDSCLAGACVGADPVICTALNQCHEVGTCNPATGECSDPHKANGTACDDGDACTRADACLEGVCIGADPVTCDASDQCHEVGACDPATGQCSNPAKVDGAACDDGSACTRADICVEGRCEGTDPVVCTALNQCHEAGVCDPATGLCSNPEKPTVTVARFSADADAYTDANDPTENFGAESSMRVDSAPARRTYLRFTLSGIGGTPVEVAVVRLHTTSKASAGSDDGGAIRVVRDTTWDELALTHDNRPSVNDPVLSSAGPVVPSQAVDFDVTAAVGGDGVYSFIVETDSNDGAIYFSRESGVAEPELIVFMATACDDDNACTQTDTCVAGSCVGADPVICTALDQCHEAGVCDPATGVCPNPAKADGTACDDGDACTQSDACDDAACVGADPVICVARDQCHEIGACDPKTGLCSDPEAPNGSPCDDGTLCTQADACADGVCVGSDPVVCGIPDQCHDAGVCDPATGQCSNPAKGDGVPCDDGNACTCSDACVQGICRGTAVVCPGPDQCREAGVCDPATGQCSNAPRADGLPCDDGDVCSMEDACIGGACVGIPSPDEDADGICDAIDLCPGFRYPDQWDMDHDGVGDFCQCNSPAPGRCIAGGGSKRTDCLLEINTPGYRRISRKRNEVKPIIDCKDGDPTCDMDGIRNKQCTFAISFCFGNSDPRYPSCTPDRVHSMEVLSPRVSSRRQTNGTRNAAQLEQELRALGLGITRRGQVIAQSVGSIGDGTCTPSIELVVRAPGWMWKRPVRRKFKVRATDMSGRRDTDRFMLICR